jgi:hypothetical protein
MFSPGTLVNVPHFRGKALLVVSTEAENTLCLWSSDSGEMGEVLIPTALLQEVQPAPAPLSPSKSAAEALSSDETLPGDWFRKASTGPSSKGS